MVTVQPSVSLLRNPAYWSLPYGKEAGFYSNCYVFLRTLQQV